MHESKSQHLDRGRQKGMWRVSESHVSSGDAKGYLVLWVKCGEADGKSLACNDRMQADCETVKQILGRQSMLLRSPVFGKGWKNTVKQEGLVGRWLVEDLLAAHMHHTEQEQRVKVYDILILRAKKATFSG